MIHEAHRYGHQRPSHRHRVAIALAAAGLVGFGAVAAQSNPPPPDVYIAPPQPTVPASPASSSGSLDGRHTLNLKGVDINLLIETVGEITGKSFIVDPTVQGLVTVISGRPMTSAEIYNTFLAVLRVHGYAAVSSGGMTRIVPEGQAMQSGTAMTIGRAGGDDVVTRIIDVAHVPATELVPLLRPLMPQQANLSAHAESNTLLITDRAANVDRIAGIVRRIDQGGDTTVEMIALTHASADEVARTLASMTAAAGGQSTVPGVIAPARAKLVADPRTNSILLSGDPTERLRLRALIAHLDTPIDGGDATEVHYIRYARAADLVPILESIAGTLTGIGTAAEAVKTAVIQFHEETNAIVVTASPAIQRELSTVIRQLDVRRAQVLVEAVIAEVSDDLADEIGVQWQSTNYDGTGSGIIGGTNFPRAGGGGSIVGALTNPLGAAGTGLSLGYIGGRVELPIGPDGSSVTVFQVGALVRALRGDGRANVLSSPSVVTLDNHEAVFKVVQEIPFLTGQYVNTSTNGGTNLPTNPFQTIERRDVGLILKVTPHINEGDTVRLDIHQEVSALAPTAQVAVDLITQKRELSTSVMVRDGGLLVLGGLESDEIRESIQGVPGLSRIPLLGNLFKSRTSGKTSRSLMLFMRPHILRDFNAEQSLSQEKYNLLRTEQLRMQQNREMKYDGPETPVLPALPPLDRDLMRSPPAAAPLGATGNSLGTSAVVRLDTVPDDAATPPVAGAVPRRAPHQPRRP